jgi:hypothetical protein
MFLASFHSARRDTNHCWVDWWDNAIIHSIVELTIRGFVFHVEFEL